MAKNVRKNALILQAWVTGGSSFDSLLQDIVHTVSGQRRTADIWNEALDRFVKAHPDAKINRRLSRSERMLPDDLSALTPLIYAHVTPYGTIRFDMSQRLAIEQDSVAA